MAMYYYLVENDNGERLLRKRYTSAKGAEAAVIARIEEHNRIVHAYPKYTGSTIMDLSNGINIVEYMYGNTKSPISKYDFSIEAFEATLKSKKSYGVI